MGGDTNKGYHQWWSTGQPPGNTWIQMLLQKNTQQTKGLSAEASATTSRRRAGVPDRISRGVLLAITVFPTRQITTPRSTTRWREEPKEDEGSRERGKG